MRRSRSLRKAAARALATLILAPALPGVAAHAQTAAARDLLLEVRINGVDTEQVATFHAANGHLSATADELRALGLVPPPGAAPDTLVDLADIAGVRATINEQEQSLSLEVPVAALAAHRIGQAATPKRVATSASPTGILLNYDVTATGQAHALDAFGLGSARLFGAFGTLQADVSVTSSRAGLRAVRLGTTYSWSDPDRLRTVSAGDVVSGALPSSRSLRFGGAQISTNFALRPDLVTYPLPAVSGGAAVPSTVDILVNGVRQLSTPVAAGPFYIPQLPIVTGAGQVSVAVRDAAGRQTTQTSSFYVSSALLRPGLTAFSLEAGAIRRNFGSDSNNYGPLAAAATGRRGVTQWLTLEGHGEASARVALASGGGTLRIGTLAVATGALGVSRSPAGTGGQSYLAIERTAKAYHLGASALTATRRFRDLGTLVGDPPPRRILQANAGLILGRQGSIGIAYTSVTQPGVQGAGDGTDLATDRGFGLRPGVRTSLISATYSRELFGRAYLYATGYGDLKSRKAAMSAGISFRFGGRGSINTQYETSSGQATIDASRPAFDPGDIGWRAYAATGAAKRLLGEMRYRGRSADVGLGIDSYGGSTFVQATARGSVVAMGGAVYAANTITDGFALVDTQGLGNVAVTLNNRPVGRTNAHGRLLVPGLVSYQPNKLGIDPSDLPLDVNWQQLEASVAPGDRSGAIARFGVRRLHEVLAIIRLADGSPLPVGSRLFLDGGAEATESGFDGQAYFPDLVGAHRFKATMPDGTQCQANMVAPPANGALATVDTVCDMTHSSGDNSGTHDNTN